MTVEHSTTDKDVCLFSGKSFKALYHLICKRLASKLLHQLLIVDGLGDSINYFSFYVPRCNLLILVIWFLWVGGAHKSDLALVTHQGRPFIG